MNKEEKREELRKEYEERTGKKATWKSKESDPESKCLIFRKEYTEHIENKVIELEKKTQKMNRCLDKINDIMWGGHMIKSKGISEDDGNRIMQELEKWASL